MTTIITSHSEKILDHFNPISIVRNLWHHRSLIHQFTKREIEGRYKGSFLGILWSFINPLILLLIYTFVFGVVFKSRWANTSQNNLGEFAIVIFSGLIVFNIFSECINRSTTLIISAPNYVKKVVFPLEILVISVLGSAIFHAIISLIIIIIANIIINHTLSISILVLPIIALPLFMMCLGLGWFLASLGVFIRDINYAVGLLVQVLIFTAPIFYPLENVPKDWQSIVMLNPLTSIVLDVRNVILWNTYPNWMDLFIRIILTTLIAILGYSWFMKTKKGFADVL